MSTQLSLTEATQLPMIDVPHAAELDLDEIERHMHDRDWLPGWAGRQRWDDVHLALADDVPGLVAEVKRLRAAVAALTPAPTPPETETREEPRT